MDKSLIITEWDDILNSKLIEKSLDETKKKLDELLEDRDFINNRLNEIDTKIFGIIHIMEERFDKINKNMKHIDHKLDKVINILTLQKSENIEEAKKEIKKEIKKEAIQKNDTDIKTPIITSENIEDMGPELEKKPLPLWAFSNPIYPFFMKNFSSTSTTSSKKNENDAYVEYNRLRNMKIRSHDSVKFMPDIAHDIINNYADNKKI